MALIPNSVSEPFLYLFSSKKRHFSQVFVPHILIFKKLHLLLLSKMEVQAENAILLIINDVHILHRKVNLSTG